MIVRSHAQHFLSYSSKSWKPFVFCVLVDNRRIFKEGRVYFLVAIMNVKCPNGLHGIGMPFRGKYVPTFLVASQLHLLGRTPDLITKAFSFISFSMRES